MAQTQNAAAILTSMVFAPFCTLRQFVLTSLLLDNTDSVQGLGVGGQLRVLNLYRAMGESHPVTAPRLNLGDVLVFTKCTVHTCSGDTRAPGQYSYS